MEMYMDDKSKLLLKKRSQRSSPAAGERTLTGLKSRVSSTGPAGRLASLVKEQRARFYIMRRCVTMLVCWRD
ncbi:hypothetical protein PR202_gb24015 [Eleusine coracana subsp. coracana]|uniref:ROTUNDIFOLIA like 8 n=1 Tax=Eleusine coracana subsp. coracana TaxID=191504 RepID=A0AAV5FHP6_ELECO|nr:hypothetical protein PR202_gb24015 [Eleusine coracana subsp. coracana]